MAKTIFRGCRIQYQTIKVMNKLIKKIKVKTKIKSPIIHNNKKMYIILKQGIG